MKRRNAPKNQDASSNKRFDNIMRLGKHLAAILENPETPVAIHNGITDEMNDLINRTSPGIAADVRLNWPRIAEHLLSQSSPEDPPDARRRDVMELGEHLAAILKNPELPKVLLDEIGHALSNLIGDSSSVTSAAEDLEEHWPHIAEFLLSENK